jgi:hypothetical protein
MRVIFDITNLLPGKDDSGGGIWVYASRLLSELDEMAVDKDLEIICLKNKRNPIQHLKNIELLDFDLKYENFLHRMHWLHVRLPKICKRYKADLLHRVVPEMPLFNYCKSARTLQDLMFNFYLNNKNTFQSGLTYNKAKFQILNANTRHVSFTSNTVINNSLEMQLEDELIST